MGHLSVYRIREVDGHDETDVLQDLHRLTFFDTAPMPDFTDGHWWIAGLWGQPTAFAGMVPSTHYSDTGYFTRVGVVAQHTGCGLALRLMRAIERRARLNGWKRIVSDCTTDNLPSANNFIRQGWRLFRPEYPWALSNSLYWSKIL